MERRNPYLTLGLPYGVDRKVAAGAYARALRKAGTEGFPFSREDLNWALHQIEQDIHAPETHLDYLRIPAVPGAYEPPGEGIAIPVIQPVGRGTTSRQNDHVHRTEESVTQAVCASLGAIVPKLLPEVSRPDRPPEDPRGWPPPRAAEPVRADAPRQGWSAATWPAHDPDKAKNSPAAVAARVVARVIDFMIIMVPAAIFARGGVFFSSFLAIGMFGYSTLLEGIDGQTVGKRLLRLHVVSKTGHPMGAGVAARRNAIWLVGLVPVLGILLMIGAGSWAVVTASSRELQQGFHDTFAGTVVTSETKM